MKYKYLLFNKPYGVLSQFTDEGTGHPTLKDFINVPGVYAAGRLDRDSEGLLLLTDDGQLIKQLTDPVQHAQKTYLVQVEGDPTQEKLNLMKTGVIIGGYQTLPCEIRLIPEPEFPPREKPITPHGPTSWLEIKLREGKKRQIRHMSAAVGLFTLRIVRVAIASLELGKLPKGKWRELSPLEVKEIKR
jgi:23S rRNA pseudouridine2457 synthase